MRLALIIYVFMWLAAHGNVALAVLKSRQLSILISTFSDSLVVQFPVGNGFNSLLGRGGALDWQAHCDVTSATCLGFPLSRRGHNARSSLKGHSSDPGSLSFGEPGEMQATS